MDGWTRRNRSQTGFFGDCVFSAFFFFALELLLLGKSIGVANGMHTLPGLVAGCWCRRPSCHRHERPCCRCFRRLRSLWHGAVSMLQSHRRQLVQGKLDKCHLPQTLLSPPAAFNCTAKGNLCSLIWLVPVCEEGADQRRCHG